MARGGKADSAQLGEDGNKSPKQHAINMVAVAEGILAKGQVDEACVLASRALDTGRIFESERVVRHVMTFNNKVPDSQSSEVKRLKKRLAEIYS